MSTSLDDIIGGALVPELTKEDRWLSERATCYITASVCPALMKSGRGKNQDWGEGAKAVLFGAKYQKRTGAQLEQKDFYQFKWGHDNEPRAFEWLRRNNPDLDIKDCSEDFKDIVIQKPFKGFGDSPDGFILDDNNTAKTVIEIKSPVDQIKIEKLREEDSIHDAHEYYWQFIAHFIGTPDAEVLWWVIYDAYVDDAHIIKMYRKDHLQNIEKLTARIKDAIYVLKKCIADPENYKIGNIDNILNERND